MKRLPALATVFLLLAPGIALRADMNSDPQARQLLSAFEAMQQTSTYLDDDFNTATKGTITGPVSFGPGRNSDQGKEDRAALFPQTKETAVYIYYGAYHPLRGAFSLDFKVTAIPPQTWRLVLLEIGTAGNTTMLLAVGPDGAVHADIVTRRGTVELFSDPVAVNEWHHLQWYYGPEGSVLAIDGLIQDYSIDCCVPWNYDCSNAFYLGDRPYWDVGRHKGYFSAGDNFVGLVDNLKLVRLERGGAK